MSYLSELKEKYAISTLWSIFSMLKSTLTAYHGDFEGTRDETVSEAIARKSGGVDESFSSAIAHKEKNQCLQLCANFFQSLCYACTRNSTLV